MWTRWFRTESCIRHCFGNCKYGPCSTYNNRSHNSFTPGTKVVIITKDGEVKPMKDFPLAVTKFTVRSTTITVDPLSGRYLFMVPGKKFVELDPDKNEYRLIDDFTKTKWPFYHYDGTVTAYIPEYGVTFWADRKKVHLYKHKVCTGDPLPAAPAEAEKKEGE